MRRRSAVITFLSTVLAATLLLTPLAFAATEAELREHEEAAREAREAADAADAAAAKLAVELEGIADRIDAIESDIAAIADDIAKATARRERLQSEVDQLRSQVNEKQSQIDATQAEHDRQQGLLASRVQSTYKQGDFFFLEMLFDAVSIEDLIARTTLAQRVIRQNEQIASDLKETQIELEKAKAELDRTLEAVNTKRAEAAAEEQKLLDLRARHASKLNEQQQAEDRKTELMVANKESAKKLRALAEEEEAESQRIADELYGSGSGYFAGEMAWPVPGFYRVSSPYGYRIHPIFGTRKLHTGIDIGRNLDPPKSIGGAAIVSAGDGTVIYAGWRGGYGNTVMVDHGNGVVTLYAHQPSGGITVSKGQRVSRGQRIGTVGSTGYSTGPHLHFEVRINGTPTDPMPYLR
ncbi:MAG: peptidoglycan DD-metalloendopeptidase family protein [Anaerosomatales bacterium]|nr:peptidoglycan DD-metalloendopeptidase family protein [Anaerosomatales bacterium]